MMLACVPIAVLTVWPQPYALSRQGADTPAAESHTPAVIAGTKDERAAKAADFYGQGRFVEASLEFEGLHRDFPDEPRFLFNAGATRYAAQHYAHAVAYFTEYLARTDIKDSDAKEARAQLDEARNKVASVQVTVQVPPGSREEVTVVVRHVARGAADLRPELLFTARPSGIVAALVIQLEPGGWILQARGDGYAAVEDTFEIRGLTAQPVRLQLAAAPPPTAGPSQPSAGDLPPPKSARKFAIGLTVAGGLTTVAGAAVLTAGALRRGGASTCDGDVGACKTDLMLALRTRDAGAGVLGAGLGALAGGLVWLAKDPGTRKKAWIVGGVVGGVAAIGGYAGLLVASKPFNVANTAPVDDWSAHFGGPGKAPLKATTAAVFGLGVGLVVSSVASLLVQRRRPGPGLRALRVDGAASPWLTGLVVSGRF
jgi:hypothetical protein